MAVMHSVAWLLSLLLPLLVSCSPHASLPGSQLQAAIDTAISRHQAALSIVNNYTFTTEGLLLSGAANFTLDAVPGVSLRFDCGYGFQVANSTDTTIANLVIRYTQPCFAQVAYIERGGKAVWPRLCVHVLCHSSRAHG
jgi:hypothetical protein